MSEYDVEVIERIEEENARLAAMTGKKVVAIDGMEKGSEEIIFHFEDASYIFYHRQDCCEDVRIEDVCGDPNDLIGEVLMSARMDTNSVEPPAPGSDFSYTWTFYTFRTHKGTVVVRWFGSSNGCYSEEVSFKSTRKGRKKIFG